MTKTLHPALKYLFIVLLIISPIILSAVVQPADGDPSGLLSAFVGGFGMFVGVPIIAIVGLASSSSARKNKKSSGLIGYGVSAAVVNGIILYNLLIAQYL